MKKLTLILLLGIILIGFVGAETSTDYKTHKRNTELNFTFTDNQAGQCNITTIDTPDGAVIWINQIMEQTSNTFLGSIGAGNFTQLGIYCIWMNCEDGYGAECRDVTENGISSPEGIVIVGFGLILILILAGSVVMIVKAMGHIVDRDFDLMDVAKMWGLFFALLGINQLAIYYLGSREINDWLSLFINLYAFPMVIVPLIAFFLSIFNMNKEKKKKANQW